MVRKNKSATLKRFKVICSPIKYEVRESGLHEVVEVFVLGLCHLIFDPLDFSVVARLECVGPIFKQSEQFVIAEAKLDVSNLTLTLSFHLTL